MTTHRSLIAAIGAVLSSAALATDAPFSKAELFFELNDSDGDLGLHAALDGDAWRRLEIEDPEERRILDIYVTGRLRRQGLTEINFESAEPPFSELKPADFFLRFPEGRYEISAVKLDGGELESIATISHLLPAPAANIRVDGVLLPASCRVQPLPKISIDGPVEIEWDPVVRSHPTIGRSGPIEIGEYEVVLEREGFTASMRFEGDETELEASEDAFESGERVKIEILARATNGNRTAVETCFDVE